MRLNLAAGRLPLHVAQDRDYIVIQQDRRSIKLTEDEALRVADALVDFVERRS